MHLTKLERLLLIQQSSILAALRPAEAEAHAALAEMLRGGYKLYYAEALAMVAEDMPEEESLFVLRTLQMYAALDAYAAAHPQDAAVAQHPWARFRGFDPKLEPQHHGFAIFLMQRKGKFPEQFARAATVNHFDPQGPAIPHVRPMTVAWEAQGEPSELTHAQASALLLASGI